MNKILKNAHTYIEGVCIFMDKKEKSIKENNINEVEVGEDTTKYGEFISSYFAWVSLPEQKAKAEKLQNITKKNN